ncbi:hypothetical protein Goshw_006167 [Gossypium schwendimanii]|uniref:Uncharacterized protein n=2 Tax=Gossypium TaxID=3633 RepID=A0A7J9BLX4_GOSGO|nr:hypothetical protein [Gossypium gossypioides]MBA0852507.1 hypothetical protein [Gossypium schwendimanii]
MSWRHSKWPIKYQFNCAILVLRNFT